MCCPDETLLNKDREAALGALMRQAQRPHDLTTNLFDLVALDQASPSVMPGLSMMIRPVTLADKVRSAAEVAVAGRGAALTIDIGPDVKVMAEPKELERVFVNLLTNARTHGGPNVIVRATRHADEVVVDVVDDGPGVPDDYLPSLFAPFAKRRFSGQGPGLGLAVVHQLMASFGGAISYHRAEPHGSVFTLRFAVD